MWCRPADQRRREGAGDDRLERGIAIVIVMASCHASSAFFTVKLVSWFFAAEDGLDLVLMVELVIETEGGAVALDPYELGELAD